MLKYVCPVWGAENNVRGGKRTHMLFMVLTTKHYAQYYRLQLLQPNPGLNLVVTAYFKPQCETV